MLGIGLALALTGQIAADPMRPFTVQFLGARYGEQVQVSIDGGRVRQGYAGKMAIRDRNLSRASVCANVRAPMAGGQFFQVRPLLASKVGGSVGLAGKIVAKSFAGAQSRAQCAGLQLAVWEAVEDGGRRPDFYTGRFQARGSVEAIRWAEEYYAAVDEDTKDSVFLAAPKGEGQSQLMPALDYFESQPVK